MGIHWYSIRTTEHGAFASIGKQSGSTVTELVLYGHDRGIRNLLTLKTTIYGTVLAAMVCQ